MPVRFLPSQRRRLLSCLAAACALAAGCRQQPPAPPAVVPKTVVASGSEDAGAVSSDAKPPRATQVDLLKGTRWPELQLLSGDAWIDCDPSPPEPAAAPPAAATPPGHARPPARHAHSAPVALGVADAAAAPARDPPADTDADQAAPPAPDADAVPDADADAPRQLVDLGYPDFESAMSPCRERGAVRLRYEGKISGDFTALVQRTAAMADRLGIGTRILDIDSTGGRVEDAMPAGDAIAGSHWTIRVRADSICHSACVLVLAAGDDREIAGKVGIHRMVRVGSQATTRAELSQELREVYGEIKEYLERNGASAAVADLMMTVPNRSLRLLSEGELREYGLSGTNAVQDDLDRIILARKCGDDFVKRRDAFMRAYASRCGDAGDPAAADACALALRGDYGFPDENAKCAADGPVARMRRMGGSAPAAAPASTATAGETAAAAAGGTARRGR